MNNKDFESKIEFFINMAEYNKVLNLLNNEESKSLLAEEDIYFYRCYCLCKLEDGNKIKEILQYFIKILSKNNTIKYKNAILNLFREIYIKDSYITVQYIELKYVLEFFNKLKKIISLDDTFLIKVFHYLFYMGIYSPEEYEEIIETVLSVNKSNPEIYEIKANFYYFCGDTKTAIENLQTALLLNKNAKQRYLKLINELNNNNTPLKPYY